MNAPDRAKATMNVKQSVPSIDDSAQSVKEQVWALNGEWRGDSDACLIDRHRYILAEQGAVFEYGAKVVDVDFVEQVDSRHVEALTAHVIVILLLRY